MSTLMIIDSGAAPAARCMVCGNDIAAGQGVTAHYGERTLRFKCPGCAARFEADPERYLAGEPDSCCGGHGADEASPASEWRCRFRRPGA